MSAINSKNEKLFQFFWTAFFIIITCIAMIPILRVLAVSLSGKNAILAGKVFILPVDINIEAYARALQSGSFVLIIMFLMFPFLSLFSVYSFTSATLV